MTMIEPMLSAGGTWIDLLLGFAAGVLIGGIYFGGLWLTVSRAPGWRHPGLGMAASLLLRLALTALALYALAGGHWLRYAGAVPGIWLARRYWLCRFDPARGVRG